LIAAILAPWVAMGYAFVSMLPLSVLIQGKNRPQKSSSPAQPSMGL
jgi:hypothetical protein